MPSQILSFSLSKMARSARLATFGMAMFCAARYGIAQDTPLISGGVAFLHSTDGGNTTYLPIIEPLLAAPIGSHVLIESRATLLEAFSPNGGGKPGYDHSHVISLNYLQGDFFATPHLTVVGGSF